jgi:transposase
VKLVRGAKDEEHAMSHQLNSAIAVIGIDIGKNSFHVVGHDQRGAIVLRQKWSRRQVETRLANLSPCLIGMEACVGAHHLSRKLLILGHDTRLMPGKYVRPYSKGLVPKQISTGDRTILGKISRRGNRYLRVRRGLATP